MNNKNIEQELIEFFKLWDFESLSELVRDLIPIVELYDARIEKDEIAEFVQDQDKQNVILLRTSYLLSKIADRHTGILSKTKIRHPGFYKRLEAKARSSKSEDI